MPQIIKQWGKRKALGTDDQFLEIEAHFFIPSHQQPDLDNAITSVSDLLEKAGVVSNDKAVKSWDGTRVHYKCTSEAGTIVIIREFDDELILGEYPWEVKSSGRESS